AAADLPQHKPPANKAETARFLKPPPRQAILAKPAIHFTLYSYNNGQAVKRGIHGPAGRQKKMPSLKASIPAPAVNSFC
ncbi:hypothetical protein, partial [Akkermansia sp.]|uniref:hypothetical protein n=1 Tax=Akkermansia sp. TaxID=1872421 RepID=UPI003AB03EBC